LHRPETPGSIFPSWHRTQPSVEIIGLAQDNTVVSAAIRAGHFHIYPVGPPVDEALAVLTGQRAGTVREKATLHYLAARLAKKTVPDLSRA